MENAKPNCCVLKVRLNVVLTTLLRKGQVLSNKRQWRKS